MDEEEFSKFTRPRGKTRTTYTSRGPDGRRRRLVLSQDQKEAVDTVRKKSVLRGGDVPKFLENPEAFLPDGIDLERFSPRVRGLIPQRYQSQPYLSLTGSAGRDWFEVSPEVELIAEELVAGTAEAPGETSPEDRGHPGPGRMAESEDGFVGAESGSDALGHMDPEEYRSLCEQVLETGERHQRHGDGWVTIDPERAERFLESWDALDESADGRRTISRDRVQMILDVVSNTEELEFDAGAGDFFSAPEVPEYPPPSGFKGTLRSYQETGYRWMRFLRDQNLGGLLADDMGLGKTIQVIAYMAHLQEIDALRPALIVVPKSLMRNWEREIAKFAPRVRTVHRHHGTTRYRDPARFSLHEVVLTTYGTLRRDQLLLGQVDWTMIVCDEAQNVKNPTANVTAAVKGMKADLRIAATGTPVENGLSELWCIMDFAQPGRLGSRREFRESYERPIVDAELETEARLQASRELQERLIPHYVRRTKELVLDDLPDKTVRYYPVPMSQRQLRAYAGVKGRIQTGDRIPIAGLQDLIQVCSHPELVHPSGAGLPALLDDAPKLRKTLEILEDIRQRGEKVVVFTRYRQMQDILRDLVSERFGFVPRVINGTSAGDHRQQMVDVFNEREGFHVMILSPEAAGVGLNITGANHAIHYTRLWNPAKENQATDRIHRMGQKRPVTVHYPVVEGDGFKSVEQHLADLLDHKLELARDVLVPRAVLDVSGELQRRIAGEDA